MTVICYTIVGIAHNAMLPRISLVPDDRNIVAVVIGLMQGIMTAALVGVFAPLLRVLGGESSQRAWTIISVMIAVISLLLLTLCFIITREKLSATESASTDSPSKSAATAEKKPSTKAALSFLLSSRHFYIIIVLYLTGAITNGTAGIGVYFMRDVLGNADLMGIFSIVSVIPMILMMPFVPKLFSALGKRKTVLCGLAVVIVTKVPMILFPTNIPIMLASTFIGTLAIVPLWLAMPTMVCDLVDYGDYKQGIRTEGLATSASSFGTKLGTGVGSVVLGIGLTLGGYDATLQIQSATTVNAIIIVMIVVPLVLCALCFVMLVFWDLEKHKAEVEEYMKSRV
jgi:GPH family glycoside/pentoside/hexuronide:cation symporter